MDEKLKAFLESIQKRAFSGSGIGTAAGYVQTVLNVAKADGFCRQFPKAKADDFTALMKAAGDKLVYRCPVKEPLTAITKAKAGGKEYETFGKPTRKDAGVSAASIMDFENILTTKEQDRDGDILHPKGCKVDPSAPLLWQHIPTEPIGKMVQVVEVTDDHIKTHCAIADTPLGNLSAKLVEFGALRISHGFKPLNWKALSEGDATGGMITGWEVIECEVMEVSLVSVPANVGAVITAYQKNTKSFQLAGPLVEAWAKSLWDDRPAVVVSGFGGTYRKGKTTPVVVNVNLNNPTTKAADDKPKDDDEDKKKKDDKPADDKPKDDPKEGDDKKGDNLLSEIAERAEAMGQDEKLSSEARARCSVVGGILRDIGAGMSTALEKIQAAVDAQNIAGITEAQQELAAMCGQKLQRAAAELAALAEASGEMDDGAAGAVQEMAEAVASALSGVVPNGGNAGGEGGGTGEWVELEGESEEEKDDDETEDDESEEGEEETDSDKDDETDEEEEKYDDETDEEEEKYDDETEDDDAGKDGDGSDADDEDDEKDDSSDEGEFDADDDDDSEEEGAKSDDDDDSDEEKDDDEDEREDKDADDDDDEEKDMTIDPDEENPGYEGSSDDKADDDEEREEKGEDDDDGDKKPKKSKPKKSIDLTALARKLAAEAISGEPANLAEHRTLAAAVLAGDEIDPGTLVMYRSVCGAVLKKLGDKKKK